MEPVQTEPTVHAPDGIGGQNACSPQRTATGALFAMGFWAVADQTLFAMSNFVLNIVLGRWLTAEEYGAFATAYAVFLLVGTGHQALILEPMLCVTGAGVAAMGSVLRALERPQHVFMAYVISAAVASSAGVGLMLSGGVWGSGLGMVLSSLATCGAMGWLLWFTPQATGSREALLEDLSAGGSL